MIPLAVMSIATVHRRYTKGVASPLNGVENCGLKNVETAGPMMAADMMTAPGRPTALARRRTLPSAGCDGPCGGSWVVEVTAHSQVFADPVSWLAETPRAPTRRARR